MKRLVPTVGVMVVALLSACKSEHISGDSPDAAPDAYTYSCLTASDQDEDGISDHDEGAGFALDTDGDGTPDFQDPDSDGDGLPDLLEARDSDLCTPPPDSDGDTVPDYLDTDSDDDGCLDGDEDRDHNGVVGICQTFCPSLDPAECGPGQACLATGLCDPPVTTACAQGETDPRVADTDGDGVDDCDTPVNFCEPQSAQNPLGRRPVQFYTPSAPRFQLALEEAAVVQQQIITSSSGEDCSNSVDDDGDGDVSCEDSDCFNTSDCGGVSVTFDLEEPTASMAGFALARAPQADNVEDEAQVVLQQLAASLGASHVVTQSAGSSVIQLASYPARVNVRATLSGLNTATASDLRNDLIAVLMGRQQQEFFYLPDPFGPTANDFVLSFSVQWRDSGTGSPVPYVVIMGGLASLADAEDPAHTTWRNLADASNGTGLADVGDAHENECELYLLASQSKADILWVIDGAALGSPGQPSIGDSAPQMFTYAVSLGLDFRMGVTNMAQANSGVFCTHQAESNDHFLTPANLTRFQACALEPAGSLSPEGEQEHGLTQGYHAIVNHLPRAEAPNRIRPDAQLAIIYVSDERAQELEDQGCATDGVYGAVDPTCVQPLVQPTLNLLSGLSDPEAVGIAYAITGPPEGCPAASEPGQGYDLVTLTTAGLQASICQPDLWPTLRALIEDIAGHASPLVLTHTPISLSLAVRLDGVALERSQVDGFDYSASANTIFFASQPFDPLAPAEVLVSYSRWVTSLLPPD